MLLTPDDVRRKTFTSFTGLFRPDSYDADEVDEFLDEMETTLTVLGLELARLRKELSNG